VRQLQRWAVLGTVLALAGCAGTGIGETTARNQPRGDLDIAAAQFQAGAIDPKVVRFVMDVPASLRISESNSYYPMNADIVWRGDSPGDRRVQVASLFEEGARRAIQQDAGSRDVVAVVTLERFHGVTERTRFSVGGVYSIRFRLDYVDAATAEPVGAPRVVQADLPAPGGRAAVELDRAGQTERVRVTDHLAWTLAQEFARPIVPGT
jgi:hypothetical protein